MRVFVTRRLIGLEGYADQVEMDIWPDELPPAYGVLIERAAGCAGLLTTLNDRIDAALMDALPGLKVISQCAVGVNNIDLAAAKARGIPVGHTPGVLTEATADMTFALLLASARHVVAGAAYAKSGAWRTWIPTLLLGQAVGGATLGIIGMGRIGTAVARRARGFNMRVLAYSRTLTAEAAAEVGAERAPLDRVLRESDFVSLHTPLTPDTHHLIGARELALMKPSATLINTARGEVVDPVALVAALRAGRPGYAALDVTEPEPLPPDHPLFDLPNCLIVPHLGSATEQTRRAMTDIAMQNLIAGLRGEKLAFQANP
jgi:lactate dehydrogenase-like 2-hydroxyacid dehydrogenase